MTNDASSAAFAAADEGTAGRTRSTLAGSIIAGRRRPDVTPRPATAAATPKPAAKPVARAATKPVAKPATKPAATSTAKPAAKRRTATKAPEGATDEGRPARTRRSRAASEEPVAATPVDAAADRQAPTVSRRRRTTRPAEAPEAPEPTTAAATTAEVSDTPRVVSRRRRTETPATRPAAETPAAEPAAPPPTAVPSTGLPDGTATEIGRLRALVEAQRVTLAELKAGMLTLAQQVDRSGHRPRLAVFVDVPNLMYGVENGRTVHMGRLLDMLREGRELVRATAYCPISDDPREPVQQQKFVAPFVPYDYRIVTKPLKRFADGSIKGNFDVEMAIDMVHMADRVDVMAIVSGDADFSRAVESVQGAGVHVEVVAFLGSTSLEMRALADRYVQLDRHAEWLVS